ncbi:hypothetical protein EEL32_18205 [Brevibacillus laterosporus]|nr:hypothetical protein [Brevibacillus laterosporus]TPG83038.1 hypothetical protein EEL32_18205 [Brevibacillus laterosporus]
MWKWMVAIALAFMGFQAPVAYAADRIEIKTKVPFAEVTSQDNLIRVYADITNNGDAVTGELRFTIEEIYGSKRKLPYLKEITMQKGETKHVFFDLPSEDILDNGSRLRLGFYQGDQLLAKVTPSYQVREKQSDQVSVVVLDQHENSMQFLNQVKQESDIDDQNKEFTKESTWNSMLVSNIIPEELPTETHVLSNINMLVIGDISKNGLSSKQMEGIKEWVYAGGNLLVSAATPSEILESFKEWMPALTKQPGVTKDLSPFTEMGKKSVLPVQQIEVYNKSLPLFSTQKVGLGTLFFANYDVNAQPLASWEFNRQLWSKLVSQYELNSQVRFPYLNRNPAFYNLANHIPDVHVPSASLLFLVWIGYVLLIGPILYVLLKRRDRRDWAWGIIPVSALLVSVGALSFGKNLIAPNDKIYTVNQIISIKPDLAILKSDATVLKRSGGDIRLDSKDGLIVPGNLLKYTQKKDRDNLAYTIRQNDQGQFQTTINQIPYMTQKPINGGGLVKDVGEIQADLLFEQEHIKGTITNKSVFDYQELYLTMGERRMELGSLAKGETKQINEEVKPFYKQDFSFEEKAYPTQNERQKALLYNDSLQGMSSVSGLNLVGVSESPYKVFTTSEQGFIQNYLTFVQQPILLKHAQTNHITYPYGTLRVRILSTEGKVVREDNETVTMFKGKVTYGVQIPSNVELTNVLAPLDNLAYQSVKKAVYHATSREWKILDSNSSLQLKTNPQEYVNNEGFVLIRFIYEGDSPVSIPQPVFQLEGKEKR